MTKTADQVRHDVCGDKIRHPDASHARGHARALGDQYRPYRCPFCASWHVGHIPSMKTVEQIARVIRGLDPEPQDPAVPDRPRRRCTGHPTCPNPAGPGGRCTDCARTADADRNRRRVKSLAVYRSKAWKRLRRRILNERPYCEWGELECMAPSAEVDHMTRIEDGGDPWDPRNLMALCKPHHSAKTARETNFGGRHE